MTGETTIGMHSARTEDYYLYEPLHLDDGEKYVNFGPYTINAGIRLGRASISISASPIVLGEDVNGVVVALAGGVDNNHFQSRPEVVHATAQLAAARMAHFYQQLAGGDPPATESLLIGQWRESVLRGLARLWVDPSNEEVHLSVHVLSAQPNLLMLDSFAATGPRQWQNRYNPGEGYKGFMKKDQVVREGRGGFLNGEIETASGIILPQNAVVALSTYVPNEDMSAFTRGNTDVPSLLKVDTNGAGAGVVLVSYQY